MIIDITYRNLPELTEGVTALMRRMQKERDLAHSRSVNRAVLRKATHHLDTIQHALNDLAALAEDVPVVRYAMDATEVSAMAEGSVTLHEALGVEGRPFRPTHRHMKTGGLYRFLGVCKIEATWTDGVIYDNADGVVVVRDKAEFEDGRFQPLGGNDGTTSE